MAPDWVWEKQKTIYVSTLITTIIGIYLHKSVTAYLIIQISLNKSVGCFPGKYKTNTPQSNFIDIFTSRFSNKN